tara:strand:- start:875 stop:1117 length:243 start_codon:yes stop_codon:yes gene_type:complete
MKDYTIFNGRQLSGAVRQELEKKDRIINELLLCMKNPKQVWNCSNETRELVEKGWDSNIPFLSGRIYHSNKDERHTDLRK